MNEYTTSFMGDTESLCSDEEREMTKRWTKEFWFQKFDLGIYTENHRGAPARLSDHTHHTKAAKAHNVRKSDNIK
jgi:hypothetical protein